MEIFNVPELASILGISEKTVRRYLKEGVIHGRKIARKWLIHEDALRDLLQVNKEEQNSQRTGQ